MASSSNALVSADRTFEEPSREGAAEAPREAMAAMVDGRCAEGAFRVPARDRACDASGGRGGILSGASAIGPRRIGTSRASVARRRAGLDPAPRGARNFHPVAKPVCAVASGARVMRRARRRATGASSTRANARSRRSRGARERTVDWVAIGRRRPGPEQCARRGARARRRSREACRSRTPFTLFRIPIRTCRVPFRRRRSLSRPRLRSPNRRTTVREETRVGRNASERERVPFIGTEKHPPRREKSAGESAQPIDRGGG